MRLLLTSAGIKNPSINDALVDQLGEPIAESSALCIPTANHAQLGGSGSRFLALAAKIGTAAQARSNRFQAVTMRPSPARRAIRPSQRRSRLRDGVVLMKASHR